ncbi:hypothetical protein GCM10027452_17150 [Micromonospora halotolerans]
MAVQPSVHAVGVGVLVSLAEPPQRLTTSCVMGVEGEVLIRMQLTRNALLSADSRQGVQDREAGLPNQLGDNLRTRAE